MLEDIAWTADVARADWLEARLGDPGANTVTSVVPAGFEAYARVLHPAADPSPGGRRLVRWRDVSAWSGRPLEPDAPFHAVAIPPQPVHSVPPWSGRGPHPGRLAGADAKALVAVVRRHTRTPDDCWFCLWDGYDWNGTPLSGGGEGGSTEDASATPIPPPVWDGPRVELSNRRYFLYRGPAECALLHRPDGSYAQTANLWWPEDRAWCVATEVDLPWTYVAGSVALVRSLVGDPGLEAIEVAPGSPVAVVAPPVSELVQPAVEALLRVGNATVVTPVGTVDAELQLPRRTGRGSLRFDAKSVVGTVTSGTRPVQVTRSKEGALRADVQRHLEDAVIGLVGG